MKKAIFLLSVFAIIVSCKEDKTNQNQDSKEESAVMTEEGKTAKQNDGLIAIHGKFLYDANQNAAVLQTPTEVYGIVIDDKMKELVIQTEKFKKQPEDMVPVTIRGRMFKKNPNEEGWENRIEIKDILKVTEPSAEDKDVITIGKEK